MLCLFKAAQKRVSSLQVPAEQADTTVVSCSRRKLPSFQLWNRTFVRISPTAASLEQKADHPMHSQIHHATPWAKFDGSALDDNSSVFLSNRGSAT